MKVLIMCFPVFGQNDSVPKKIIKNFHFSTDVISQYISSDNYAQDGFSVVNRTNVGLLAGPIPLAIQMYTFKNKDSEKLTLSGINFSFDKLAWNKLNDLKKNNIKLSDLKYGTAIDSLEKFNILLKQLSDSSIINGYSEAKRQITKKGVGRFDSINVRRSEIPNSILCDSISPEEISRLEGIIKMYDSLNSKYSEYYSWRKETIDKYTKSKEFNTDLDKYNGKSVLDSLSNPKGVDKYLSKLNKFSIGTCMLDESPLTFSSYSFSGINIQYGRKYVIGFRYGFKLRHIYPFMSYLSDQVNSMQGNYQRVQSVSLTTKAVPFGENKIEFIHFDKSTDIPIDLNSGGGRETFIFHFQSLSQLTRGMKYKIDIAKNFTDDHMATQPLSGQFAYGVDVENYFVKIKNTTSVHYQKIGDDYFSPGNLFFNHITETYGVRSSQPFYRNKIVATGSFDKNVYGVSITGKYISYLKTASSTYFPNSKLSFNYIISISDQFYINNEVNSKEQSTISQTGIVNLITHTVFKKEVSVISIVNTKSLNLKIGRDFQNYRISYNGNYTMSDMLSLIVGGSYSENLSGEILSIQRSISAGFSTTFLKKGTLRYNVIEFFNSSMNNSTDFSLHATYNFNTHIKGSVNLNTKYYFDESPFIYDRSTQLFRGSITYKF